VKTIAALINAVDSRRILCSIDRKIHPVYVIQNEHYDFRTNKVTTADTKCICREAFKYQEKLRSSYRYRPQFDNSITIALHIRRGDVLNKQFAQSDRWIQNIAFVNIANKIISELRGLYSMKKINVVVLTEGSTSIEKIIDVCENMTLPTTTNFTQKIRADSVSLGPNHVLEDFSTMCYSDILVTSNSGYSTLVQRLCEKPIIFGSGWDYTQHANVLKMHVIKKNGSPILNHMVYDEEMFHKLVLGHLLK